MNSGAELPEAASVSAVHESALRVLEKTGVLVQDDEAVALLRSRGARCEGRRVYLGEGMVRAALAAAPSSFVLAGRRPELGLPLGGADGRVFGSGSGAAYVVEGRTMRPGTLADLVTSAKLGHQLPAVDFNSDCMEPLDLPEEVRTRRGTHARLTASDKAIEWLASVDEDIDDAERINEILYGADWHARPRALIVLNTSSPLQISGETARILLRWARLGQPSCVTACVMGGTTGPATLAGVLAVQHAEVLAALVLAQAAREGSPFVYGGVSAMASLRTGAALFGAPEFARLARATAALGHRCGLPVRAGAAVTDAHAVDARALAESAAGLSAAAFAGGSLPLPGHGHAQFVQRALVREVRPRRRPGRVTGRRPAGTFPPATTSWRKTSSTPWDPATGSSDTRTRAATRGTSSARGSRCPSPSSAGSRPAARTRSPAPPAASGTSSTLTSRRTTSTR